GNVFLFDRDDTVANITRSGDAQTSNQTSKYSSVVYVALLFDTLRSTQQLRRSNSTRLCQWHCDQVMTGTASIEGEYFTDYLQRACPQRSKSDEQRSKQNRTNTVRYLGAFRPQVLTFKLRQERSP